MPSAQSGVEARPQNLAVRRPIAIQRTRLNGKPKVVLSPWNCYMPTVLLSEALFARPRRYASMLQVGLQVFVVSLTANEPLG